MRLLLTLFFVAAFACLTAGQTFYGTTDVMAFREGREAEFRNKQETPLKDEDFVKFKGLNYYEVDNAFRVTAEFSRTVDEKYFQMPTSSGITKKFVKYGVLRFSLGGGKRQLSVYQIDPEVRAKFPEYAHLLFVPFKDATNRTETYGGGRYIDIVAPKENSVVLDFNLAYNPNCAYGSDKYNCPIPPRENTLDMAVTAGEKRFAYAGHTKAQ